MSSIHFIGGEKGGVGKSVFSRLFSQYFIDQAESFVAFDADASHATLSRFYSEYAKPINLDVFESADQIMEAALEDESSVLVDLPAQSERFLDHWIEENGVIDMCEELQVPFIYWYVVDDGMDSARLLDQFLAKYADKITCVVVKNHGCGKNFETANAVIKNYVDQDAPVTCVDLPALHTETMRKIDALSFSFWGAEHIKSGDAGNLGLMERQRTKVWVKKSYGIFEKVFSSL